MGEKKRRGGAGSVFGSAVNSNVFVKSSHSHNNEHQKKMQAVGVCGGFVFAVGVGLPAKWWVFPPLVTLPLLGGWTVWVAFVVAVLSQRKLSDTEWYGFSYFFILQLFWTWVATLKLYDWTHPRTLDAERERERARDLTKGAARKLPVETGAFGPIPHVESDFRPQPRLHFPWANPEWPPKFWGCARLRNSRSRHGTQSPYLASLSPSPARITFDVFSSRVDVVLLTLQHVCVAAFMALVAVNIVWQSCAWVVVDVGSHTALAVTINWRASINMFTDEAVFSRKTVLGEGWHFPSYLLLPYTAVAFTFSGMSVSSSLFASDTSIVYSIMVCGFPLGVVGGLVSYKLRKVWFRKPLEELGDDAKRMKIMEWRLRAVVLGFAPWFWLRMSMEWGWWAVWAAVVVWGDPFPEASGVPQQAAQTLGAFSLVASVAGLYDFLRYSRAAFSERGRLV